ncbi:MAG TPA: cytochrome c oxidase subunit 3 [Blastocatellia bacterium]|nr:cytochrome c oxidase subunit 3 [Blastocatellia bacterium]
MTNADALILPDESGAWTLPSRRKVALTCLFVTESSMFTIFVVAYLFYVGKSLIGPYPADVLETPIVSTICLLSSSVTILLAERAFHRESIGSFRAWWALTVLLGAIFLGSTAAEWKRLIVNQHLTISTNLFGTTFYSLVGLHASHVVVGLILLTLVLVLSLRKSIRPADGERIQMISWYWHFVDVVWVVVFSVVYVIGR